MFPDFERGRELRETARIYQAIDYRSKTGLAWARGLRGAWFSLPLNQVDIAVALAGEADHVGFGSAIYHRWNFQWWARVITPADPGPRGVRGRPNPAETDCAG